MNPANSVPAVMPEIINNWNSAQGIIKGGKNYFSQEFD